MLSAFFFFMSIIFLDSFSHETKPVQYSTIDNCSIINDFGKLS